MRMSRPQVASAVAVMAVALVVTPARVDAQELTLLGYKASPPAAWTVVKTTSSMRLAQFVVGPAGTQDAAEIVVYFFGTGQGGNVAANLDRWREQFTNPGAAPAVEKVARDSSGAFPLTVAEYQGTYRRGIGAGSADSARAGQTLVAAIVETPHGTMFIQLFGPTARVGNARPAFTAFVKGIR